MENQVIQGDSLDELKKLPDNCIDSIVTDPPYELGFMGKSWDNTGIANNPLMWAECLRVLKPGGHLLAFSGTRTYHRMASAIEDAGFEVRDMIEWVYGCLSEDTEILTANGWKMLYSVFEGDYVFACDYKNDMKLQLEQVKQKFIYDYDEDAYHIKDTGYYNSELMETDHIVSKNHNVLVLESWVRNAGFGNNLYWEKIPAEKLYENIQKIGGKKTFRIPGLNGDIPCTIKKIPYKGKVWCVEVESGAFVARRKGKIFITGNSGFPKSLNIGKKIDHLIGNEALKEKEIEFVRWFKKHCHLSSEEIDKIFGWKNRAFHFFAESDSNRHIPNLEQYKILKKELSLSDEYDDFVKKHSLLLEEIREIQGYEKSTKNWDKKYIKPILNKSATEQAKEWEGWGTALKPAHEPICMARKPLAEKTIAENCLKWGTGGINIDESRVGIGREKVQKQGISNSLTQVAGRDESKLKEYPEDLGRFPANLIHDGSDEVKECFPEQKSGARKAQGYKEDANLWNKTGGGDCDASSGNASRFFKSIKQDLHCSLCYDIIDPYQLTKNICNNTNVNNVEKSLETTQATTESTALKNATGKVNENLVQNVKSAGNLCDLCGTSIAQRLVAIMQDQSQESTLGELSMPEHKRQILEKCLVSFVELVGNTDTIPTMENLNLLFGYVLNAIEEYTQKCGDTKSEDKNQWKSLIYKAKASKSERKLEDGSYSTHPTVKPIDLMEYLIKMVTPKDGIVLDPFAGSGTTGLACKNLNRNYILIEKEPEYIEIIKARLKAID